MTGTEMFDAIAHIDEDLIEGCLARMKARFSERRTPAVAAETAGNGKKPISAFGRSAIAIAAAAAAVVLMLVIISVLHIGGESPEPITPVSSMTPAPTETAEAATPEPFSAEDKAMLDNAWSIAERISETLGIAFDRDTYEINRRQENKGRLEVIFADPAKAAATLFVPFTVEDDGTRHTSIGQCMLDFELNDIDEAKWEADGEGLQPASITVTADQLEKAGLEASIWSAAEYAAGAYAALFTGLPEGNYFRCKTALPVEFIYDEETNVTTVRFVFIPEHVGEFCIGFGDILSGHLYENAERPEYDGAITSMIDYKAADNGDGSYTVSLPAFDTSASVQPDGPAFKGFYEVLELPAGELPYGSAELPEGTLGYLFDPAGNVGPVDFKAVSDDEFMILDQVNKRLLFISRERITGTISLSCCSRPKYAACFNDTVAVLDSESIIVMDRSGKIVLTAAIPEEHYSNDWNYGASILFDYIDGTLYWQTVSGKAYFLNGTELAEIPEIRSVSISGSLATVKQNGKTWVAHAEGSPIQTVCINGDVLLTLTWEGALPDAFTTLGVYYSESGLSAEAAFRCMDQVLYPSFAVSPSGRIYMLLYYEDHAAIRELVFG